MKIRPIKDLVLCEVLDCKLKQTKSGIHLPDATRGREDQARVLAVGSGGEDEKGRLQKPAVKPGDVIYFDPYKIEWAEFDGTVNSAYARPGEHMLIREQHIRGVVC